MTVSSSFRRSLLGGLASVFAVSASGQTIDLPGATSATVAWEAADGPVAGYYVIVTRQDQPPTVTQITGETQTTLSAVTGEELVVRVAAFDAAGAVGPLSPPSPTLRFLAATTTTTPDDGTTAPSPDEDPTSSEPPTYRASVPLDYTGDGMSDLLVAPGGDVTLLVMEGAQIVARHDLPELPAGWSIAAHGDYDGNGIADVLWREDESGELLVWTLQDAAVTASGTLDLSHLNTPRDWEVAGSGDIDADGRDDVVLRNVRSGELDLLLMAGVGIASTVPVEGFGRGVGVAAVADVDGDGADEVLWLDERMRRLLVGDLAGSGLATRIFTSAQAWRVQAAGDFDGDGREDLFVQRRNPDQFAVWLSDGAAVAAALLLPLPDPEWSLSASGDYDGDGRTDLLWHDGTTREAHIWFSDGDGITAETVSDAATPGVGATLGSDEPAQCIGDFDGNGIIGIADVAAVSSCLADPSDPSCALADIDGDGELSEADLYRQQQRFGWPACSTEGF